MERFTLRQRLTITETEDCIKYSWVQNDMRTDFKNFICYVVYNKVTGYSYLEIDRGFTWGTKRYFMGEPRFYILNECMHTYYIL